MLALLLSSLFFPNAPPPQSVGTHTGVHVHTAHPGFTGNAATPAVAAVAGDSSLTLRSV